jgi:hypothetical protein
MAPPVSQSSFVLVCGLGLLTSLASPSVAAEPSPSEISVARRLFEEARAAADAARWAEAAGKFRRALAIKDTPGIRFHLARCEEEQGAFVEALIEYDRARELIDAGTKAPDVEKVLPDARERVRAKVALITLRVPEGIQNVSVQVDGKALSGSVLGVPMPINPGRHRVSAISVGRTPYAHEISLGLGEVRELVIELPFATTALQPFPEAPSERRTPVVTNTGPQRGPAVSARTVALVGEASLSAVGLGTGIYFMVSKGSADERYEKANRQVLAQVGGSDPDGMACATPRPGCAELAAAQQDADRAATLATVGFVAAGVSAAAFGLTWWLWPSSSPPKLDVGAAPDRLDVRVSGSF